MIYWIFFILIAVVLFVLWTRRSKDVAFLVPTTTKIPLAEVPVHNGLLQFYKPAQEVKLDYPPKKIGCCPFSKPMSKALPMADVPMCLAAQEVQVVKNVATSLPNNLA